MYNLDRECMYKYRSIFVHTNYCFIFVHTKMEMSDIKERFNEPRTEKITLRISVKELGLLKDLQKKANAVSIWYMSQTDVIVNALKHANGELFK